MNTKSKGKGKARGSNLESLPEPPLVIIERVDDNARSKSHIVTNLEPDHNDRQPGRRREDASKKFTYYVTKEAFTPQFMDGMKAPKESTQS